ncbi:MAG: permease-like cell division protein FtsX [Bacteroidota bacterium]
MRRRSRTNFITSLFSIALVLFFVGLFASLIILGRSFTTQAKESILLKVSLVDYTLETDQQAFIDSISQLPFVVKTKYVSKEEAGKELLERTGEDISQLLGGMNPLEASLSLQLTASFLHPDSLSRFKQLLNRSPVVSDVTYPLAMIEGASRNITTLTVLFSSIGIILLIIAFYLIIGTIRLSIYSQRLSIYTMQLIGATSNFIRRPFLLNGLLHGFLASILAVLLLLGAFQLAYKWLDEMGILQSFSIKNEFIGILIGIVLFGSILGLMGSFWAVNRYLHRKLDELL